LGFVETKYNQIKVLYRKLQRRSPKYPNIDHETIVAYLEEVNKSSVHMVGMNKKLKLKRAWMENACILTFKGETQANKFLSLFNRRELIEYILRVCATWVL